MKEEMRRVLAFFNWKIEWWLRRATHFKDQKGDVTMGIIAYSNQQAAFLRDIGRRFRNHWSETCNVAELPNVGEQVLIPVFTNVKLPSL